MDGVNTEASEDASEPPILLDADFQRKLFEVPEDLEFPLEIAHHLKEKLHSVLEQNWHLKRHLDYLDKEVIELRKYRAEHREKCGRSLEQETVTLTPSVMSQRVVELSKKNRDLTSQSEMMKTKISKLIRENGSLKNMVECFKEKDSQDDLSRDPNNADEYEIAVAVTTTTPGSQQYAQLTNKVIEYRRQNQLLKMELKTALRALSQEVGDGTTPHNVLSTVSGTGTVGSWRGRQRQIKALQQKNTELQLKLKEATIMVQLFGDQEQSVMSEGGNGSGDATSPMADDRVVLASSTNLNPQRTVLVHQDKKKQEQIDKLNQELERRTMELKSCRNELKASKARIQTLEGHIKTFKSHVEILEGKLNGSEKESEMFNKEMKQVRQEISNHKERERKYRDETSIEIQEGQRALQRERAIVMRLQSVIQEKQDAIQKLDSAIIELRNKLEISCSGVFGGGVATIDRMREMESQLESTNKALKAGERERQSLLKRMKDYLNQSEDERQKSIQASEHKGKIACVLHRAEQCINECLDAGQVTSEEVLREVEHIRMLIRELKLGDLYIYENRSMPKKQQMQVELLKTEIGSLKMSLKEISNLRKNDLDNFAAITDQLKSDWAESLNIKQTASSEFSLHKK